MDGDLVPTERIVLPAGQLAPGQIPLVPRVLVVVEDDLLVQLLKRQRPSSPSPGPPRGRPPPLARCTRKRMRAWWPERQACASGSGRSDGRDARTRRPGPGPGPGRA